MLIYAEDFASPRFAAYAGLTSRRFGGDSLQPNRKWYPDLVPYLECESPEEMADGTAIAGNTELESGRKVSNIPSWYNYGRTWIFLPRSRNLTIGVLLLSCEDLNVKFLSYPDNSYSSVENFKVSLELSNYNQKANVSFLTGGDHPAIPDQAIYYDFNQPLWVWIQCDMPAHMDSAPIGTCRVWLNNDLMVTREDIFTGNVALWAEQPLYAYNNGVCVNSYSSGQHTLAVAAVNEGLGYMDSALGDINVAGLLPEQADSQWYSCHDGYYIETGQGEVLQDALHVDYSDLHTKAHVRGDDHLVKAMFSHQHPFFNDADIIAVCHRIVHRKGGIGSEDAYLRIEPAIQTTGRPTEMDRNKGQESEGPFKTLFVPYTIPYAGAFWNREILESTKFGFVYFDAARAVQVSDPLDLRDEFDTEDVEVEVAFADAVVDEDSSLFYTSDDFGIEDSLSAFDSLTLPNSYLDLFSLAYVSDNPGDAVPNVYVQWLSEVLEGAVFWHDGTVYGDVTHFSDEVTAGEEA